MSMKDEVITQAPSAAYVERLQYFNEKLMALMMTIDSVILGEETDERREAIETKLGEVCYAMELSLYSGDLSVANVAMSSGQEAKVAALRLNKQPMKLLQQMKEALNPLVGETFNVRK